MSIGQFTPFTLRKLFKWVNALTVVFLDNTSSWANYTLRQCILDGALSVNGGDKVRITIMAATNSQLRLRNVFIGYKAASGSTWYFSSTPVQMYTLDGSPGADIPAGQTIIFEAPFTIPAGASIIISTYIISGTLRRRISAGALFPSFYKSGDSAAEITPAGYTSESTNFLAVLSVDLRV